MKLRHLIVLPVLAACAAMLPPMPKVVPRPDPVRRITLSWDRQTNPVTLMVATNLGTGAVWQTLLETSGDSQSLLTRSQPRFYKLFATRYSKLKISSPGFPFYSNNVAWYYASPGGTTTPNGSYQSPYRYEVLTNLFPGVDVALISGTYTNAFWLPGRVVVNHMEPPEIGTDGYPAAYTVDIYQ